MKYIQLIVLGLVSTASVSAFAGEACIDNSQCSIAGEICQAGSCHRPQYPLYSERFQIPVKPTHKVLFTPIKH